MIKGNSACTYCMMIFYRSNTHSPSKCVGYFTEVHFRNKFLYLNGTVFCQESVSLVFPKTALCCQDFCSHKTSGNFHSFVMQSIQFSFHCL